MRPSDPLCSPWQLYIHCIISAPPGSCPVGYSQVVSTILATLKRQPASNMDRDPDTPIVCLSRKVGFAQLRLQPHASDADKDYLCHKIYLRYYCTKLTPLILRPL